MARLKIKVGDILVVSPKLTGMSPEKALENINDRIQYYTPGAPEFKGQLEVTQEPSVCEMLEDSTYDFCELCPGFINKTCFGFIHHGFALSLAQDWDKETN